MARLSSSKFSPPRYESDRHLPRHRIISELISRRTKAGKSFAFEGQAGQGKSQIAIQFLQSIKVSFAWFQLSHEEADPVLFLTELFEILRLSLPELTSPPVEKWLSQGSPIPSDYLELTVPLIQDLENKLKSDFYIVFDDLHLLEGHSQTLYIINSLLNAARRKVHFIFASRLSVLSMFVKNSESLDLQVFTNEEIALNRQEIAELFNVYLNIPISTSAVNDLYRTNEGWIMGLILAAQGGQRSDFQASIVNSPQRQAPETFLDYFSQEVLNKFSSQLQEGLVKLSLLDEIPSELARTVTGIPDIEEQLKNLEEKNFFVRSFGQSRSVFSFHHLFQESLSHIADEQYEPGGIQAIWNLAANWYRETHPEKALSYFLRASNYADSQSMLGRIGMQLLATNRLVTLQEFLSQVPDNAIQDYPWLSFFSGVLQLNIAPPSAIKYLENARIGFVRDEDEIGELAALVQLIYFHTAVDCQFNRGRDLLDRAIQLFEKHGHLLEESYQAHASNLLVLGLTFFSADLNRTKEFADFGLATAQKLGLKELEAEARLARCYRDLFKGELTACLQEIERSLPLLKDSGVSLINRGALHLAQLNLLVNRGDRPGYIFHRNLYRQSYGEDLVDQSSFGAIMRLWEIDLALADGDETTAEETLNIALASEFGSSLPHMRSLYLQYKSYLLACQGDGAGAVSAQHESLRLRSQTGGGEFIIMNRALLGAAFTRLGKFEDALTLFREGLEVSDLAGEHFVRPCLYAYRAWLHLKQGAPQAAGDDIYSMLSCLQQSGFRSFYGWDQEIMTDLLTEAVKQDIKSPLAKEIATSRLGINIGPKGDASPQIKINSFGDIELRTGASRLAKADLTSSMRRLLEMLISAPNHQLDQEYVQTLLWPEESSSRGRSNFDTLISRIRRLIKQTFKGVEGKDVLSLQNQVLSLKNCWIDVDAFRQHAKKGISHCRQQQFWQAANEFRAGLQLWRGDFLGRESSEFVDLGQSFSDLLHLFLDASKEYSRLLASNGQLQDAAKVLEKAISYDPTNEVLVRQLYDFHIQQGKSHLAQQVTQEYAKALRKEDCSDDDISRLLESFWR